MGSKLSLAGGVSCMYVPNSVVGAKHDLLQFRKAREDCCAVVDCHDYMQYTYMCCV